MLAPLPVLGLLLVLATAPGPATPGAAPGRAPGWDVSTVQPDDTGEPFVLEGRLVTADGRGVRDALIYAYHAAPNGRYTVRADGRPTFECALRTNVVGGFRIRTVLPGPAEGNAHVHFEVATPGERVRHWTVNLYRSHGAGSDSAFGMLAQIPKLGPNANGVYVERDGEGVLEAHCDLVVEKGVTAALSPNARRALGR